MLKIAIVTNIRAPYRKLQIEEFAKNKEYILTVYYTNVGYEDRNWSVEPIQGVQEVVLKKILAFGRFGYLNRGLFKVLMENDIIFIGGYEMPSYILLAFWGKILKKPLILSYDGISSHRAERRVKNLLYFLKRKVIRSFDYYFVNGAVSRLYFTKVFDIKEERIFDQKLAVDNLGIINQELDEEAIKALKDELGIKDTQKVILFSGRLVKHKRVDLIVEAISLLKNKENYYFLILGDGIEKEALQKLTKSKSVSMGILGFTSDQQELFRRYYIGDLLILPSEIEPWGLVINEAMAAKLPVICSNHCGCSIDLVKDGENGYIFQSGNAKELSGKIEEVFANDYVMMGEKSSEIISHWTHEESKKNFDRIIEKIKISRNRIDETK